MTTVPSGSVIRVWLYQNESLNPVMFLSKKRAESCVNFALSVRTVREDSNEHEDQLKENLYCEHTRFVPRSLNRLRYLGEDSSKPQQDFNYVETFRVDNLKHIGRETTFSLQERTVVRLDGIEHESLQFFIKITQDGKTVAGQMKPAQLPNTDVYLVPSIFAVLDKGDYTIKIEFVAREAEILRQPCQSIKLQIAMNRAD